MHAIDSFEVKEACWIRGQEGDRKKISKVLTSVKTAMSDFPMTSSAKAPMQRRAAALQHGMDVTIKLWEEPDPKSTNR